MPRTNKTGKVHRYAATNAQLHSRPTRPIANPADAVDPVLDARQVRVLVGGISNSTLWRWTTSGVFPAPAKMGVRRIGWRRSIVVAWLDSRQASAPLAMVA